jgi:hypothetical protein
MSLLIYVMIWARRGHVFICTALTLGASAVASVVSQRGISPRNGRERAALLSHTTVRMKFIKIVVSKVLDELTSCLVHLGYLPLDYANGLKPNQNQNPVRLIPPTP